MFPTTIGVLPAPKYPAGAWKSACVSADQSSLPVSKSRQVSWPSAHEGDHAIAIDQGDATRARIGRNPATIGRRVIEFPQGLAVDGGQGFHNLAIPLSMEQDHSSLGDRDASQAFPHRPFPDGSRTCGVRPRHKLLVFGGNTIAVGPQNLRPVAGAGM